VESDRRENSQDRVVEQEEGEQSYRVESNSRLNQVFGAEIFGGD
jgi:hypothetical protein